MSELWQVRGREPVVWGIPVYVAWIPGSTPETGKLIRAIMLTGIQQVALEHVLKQCAENHNDHWQIRRFDLEKIATRKEPQEPDALFYWEKPQESQKPEYLPEARAERDSFLDYCYQQGIAGLEDRSQLDHLWRQLCEYAVDWMVNQERSVDMYFFRLHISPYRTNWKELLNDRFPQLCAKLSSSEYEDRLLLLHRGRTHEDLSSIDLVAMRSGLLQRLIEVEHRPPWYKLSRKIETQRLRDLGSLEYAKSIVGSLRRRLEVSARLLVDWWTNLHRPSGVDVAGGFHGDYRVLADFRKAHKVSTLGRTVTRRLLTQLSNVQAGINPPVPAANGTLPALSALPSPAQDVRGARKNLRARKPKAAPGVLVPPAPQEPDPL